MGEPISRVEKYIRAALPTADQRFRDPLGRPVGESFDRRNWPTERLRRRQGAVGKRQWAAAYMQNPQTEGAGLFHRALFTGKDKESRRILTPSEFAAATEGLSWVRFYDLAYTAKQYNKPDPDFTVGTRMAANIDLTNRTFRLYLSDMVRYREGWGRVRERIREQAYLDGKDCRIVVEANGPQSAAAQDLRGDSALAEYIVEGLTERLDPELLSAACQDGFLYLQEDSGDRDNAWMSVFFDEGETYPNGGHDDTLKSATGAYIVAVRLAQRFEISSTTLPIKIHSTW